MPSKTSAKLIDAAQQLSAAVDKLRFADPVTHVYNPLDYAWAAHQAYLQRYARSSCKILLLGMNPGPWGMAQTGVPFGEIAAVRDWLKIDKPVTSPKGEHPKRPIEGFACQRSEVSGRRLWGLFAERFTDAKEFSQDHFVTNYCPLVFMESSARNVTPDKLSASERERLTVLCDAHLAEVIAALDPEWVVGIGAYAEKCAGRVIGAERKLAKILHPSPASPAANRGWAKAATKQLEAAGIW